ncbi:alpha/beta hydrolase [Actinokineospora bangkokensis]|uniref:Alpha/beta hydrolase n=1 Tax=Actinokineospora bangkokensis TaxID=1193682 RepID=A0A1Q9LRK1_9PSEU|nr:alpha/beta hydrolase [Actinokineospora bangkokensis]OLR94621.1 alpha/beta hydrolase [Actinokineospora bangkokensis]
MRRIVAATAAVGVVLGGALVGQPAVAAPAAPGPAQVAYDPAPIAWGPCASPGLARRGAECGFLVVPLDYAKPGGTTIKLAVSRIKAKVPADRYQGVVITNPGGPGGSGLTLSVLGEYVPGGVGQSYDWIGFDPRGVGSSQPALACDGSYFGYNRPFYVPVTAQLEKTWLDRSKGYAKACGTAGGDLLNHLKTTDTVNDVDVLRKALGQKQINYYGFSYGTYLGQVYATLYPERVRRMVLDGNVDPRKVWYQANLDQDVAFDKNMGIYFDWVAKHDDVYHLGTSGRVVQQKFYLEQAKLLKNPAGGVIGPDEWVDVFLSAGYYVFGWEDVAAAFSAWVNDGDYSLVKDLYDGANGQGPGSDNSFAVYLGVQCTDVQWPTNWNQWRVDNWRTFLRAPFETWGNAWFNAPCAFWPAKAGKPVTVDGRKAPAALLISETLDAATPFEGSLEVRSRFPRSSLIEGVGGTTHAGSLNGVACVDDKIAAYLATGELPARKPGRTSDATCDPVPQPDPSAAARQRTASVDTGDITRADLQKLIANATR